MAQHLEDEIEDEDVAQLGVEPLLPAIDVGGEEPAALLNHGHTIAGSIHPAQKLGSLHHQQKIGEPEVNVPGQIEETHFALVFEHLEKPHRRGQGHGGDGLDRETAGRPPRRGGPGAGRESRFG